MSFKDSRFTSQPGIPALILWGILASLLFTLPVIAQQVSLPGAEPALSGTARVGYRWQDMAGNEDLYRSLIDLGEGPKLIDLSLDYRATATKNAGLPDFFNVRSSSWGGEPASTFSAEVGRTGVYRSRLTYRRFNYFNSLSSFANPAVSGLGSSQHTLDVARGFLDTEVTIEAYQRIEPFLPSGATAA